MTRKRRPFSINLIQRGLIFACLAISSLAQGAGFPDSGQASADEINHLAITCGHDSTSVRGSNEFIIPVRRISSSRKGDRYFARYTFGSMEFGVVVDADHLNSIRYEVAADGLKTKKTGRLARLKDDFRFRIGNHSVVCVLWSKSVLSVEENTINFIVHPHFGYDPDRLILDRLTEPRNNSAQTIVLLESLQMIRAMRQIPNPDYSDLAILGGVDRPSLSALELPNFPANTEYFTAPSGQIPFKWTKGAASTIWLSGGYFNACGLNTIKSILQAFVRTTILKASLNIDMSVSTLQGSSAGSDMVPADLKGKRMLLADYPVSYPTEFRKFMTLYETELMTALKTEVKSDFEFLGEDIGIIDRIQIRIFDENDRPLRTYGQMSGIKTFDVHFKKYRR